MKVHFCAESRYPRVRPNHSLGTPSLGLDVEFRLGFKD